MSQRILFNAKSKESHSVKKKVSPNFLPFNPLPFEWAVFPSWLLKPSVLASSPITELKGLRSMELRAIHCCQPHLQSLLEIELKNFRTKLFRDWGSLNFWAAWDKICRFLKSLVYSLPGVRDITRGLALVIISPRSQWCIWQSGGTFLFTLWNVLQLPGQGQR